jgi:GNAT superfamily N-acetyltransferase
MNIKRVEEFLIDKPLRIKIHSLLSECFPDYPKGKTYYKQLPTFRLLAWEGDDLVGHLAVEHRMMNNVGNLIRVFGIVDLCVAKDFQHQKIGTQLLDRLEKLGKKHEINFLLLIAKDHEVYLKNGFTLVENNCKWLFIHDHETLGVMQRQLQNSLMVKALGKKEWKENKLDFLGHIF